MQAFAFAACRLRMVGYTGWMKKGKIQTFALALLAMPAWGHEAPRGWSYDAMCCTGRDCAPIDASTVHETPEGYVVTLMPGDHPLVKAKVERRFRYIDADETNNVSVLPPEARRSGDSEYHACVTPSGRFLCLYVPDAGS